MSTASRSKDALGPIEFIVSLALALVGVAVVVGFVVVLIGGAHTHATLGVWGDHLSGTDRTLFSLPVLLHVVWSIGFLGVTLRLIRRARVRGLFTRDVARATTHLGWFILGGWAVVELSGAVLRAVGVSHLIRGYDVAGGILSNLDWSWSVVIAGFGVVSIGRVMQRTVPLQEEIEATV